MTQDIYSRYQTCCWLGSFCKSWHSWNSSLSFTWNMFQPVVDFPTIILQTSQLALLPCSQPQWVSRSLVAGGLMPPLLLMTCVVWKVDVGVRGRTIKSKQPSQSREIKLCAVRKLWCNTAHAQFVCEVTCQSWLNDLQSRVAHHLKTSWTSWVTSCRSRLALSSNYRDAGRGKTVLLLNYFQFVWYVCRRWKDIDHVVVQRCFT